MLFLSIKSVPTPLINGLGTDLVVNLIYLNPLLKPGMWLSREPYLMRNNV